MATASTGGPGGGVVAIGVVTGDPATSGQTVSYSVSTMSSIEYVVPGSASSHTTSVASAPSSSKWTGVPSVGTV